MNNEKPKSAKIPRKFNMTVFGDDAPLPMHIERIIPVKAAQVMGIIAEEESVPLPLDKLPRYANKVMK